MRVLSLTLTVSRREVEHSSETLEAPDLNVLVTTLSDLYERLGCEASGREVMVEAVCVDGKLRRTIRLYAEEPEASPEDVMEALWVRIVGICAGSG